MTREELHELVDIVMDAREKGILNEYYGLSISYNGINFYNYGSDIIDIYAHNYPTLSDFTQAVKDYIKSLG